MISDIINENNSRKPVNKLKPYMDHTTKKIINPEPNWYKYCLKYENRYRR